MKAANNDKNSFLDLKKILVVEDQESERKTLSTILEDDGYDVIAVADGIKAIEEAKKQFINVAIIDIKLPNMDGVDVLKEIIKINDEAIIIMVTAHESLGSILSALDEGAQNYFVKPLNIDKLKIIIKRSLERQSLSIKNKELIKKLAGINSELDLRYKELENKNIQLLESNTALKNAYDELEIANSKLEELDKLKSEFLSNMSHELRTPLTTIKGYIDLTLEKDSSKIPSQVLENFRRVSSQAQHLTYLINNLFDLSKIQSRVMLLNLEKINLKAILIKSIKNVEEMAKKKNLKIEITIEDDIVILADKNRMEQVFTNILSNSVKFSNNDNSIQIYDKVLEKRKIVEIYIEDHGIGISKSKIGSIFERFYQVDSTSTRKYSGAGLGLTIVKNIIDMHHGSIRVESVINKGSIFIVSLLYDKS